MMILAAFGSAISTTCYGLDGGDGLQIAARILWGISFAALNLGSLAYAVADRANAGKRVGASRALIGVIQASCFVGGALLVLQIGPRHVFLVLGALTLLAVVAALMLPPLHTEPTDRRGFRLPMPHRLEIWGFLLGFSGDGVFLLTLAFLLKDSVTSVAPIMATALVLSLRCVMEASGGPIGGWMGDRFGARRVATATGTVLVAGFFLIACHIDVAGQRRDRAQPGAVQHADPGDGDAAGHRRLSQLAGELLDLARLRRRRRPADRAVAVPQCSAELAVRHPRRDDGGRMYFCLARK